MSRVVKRSASQAVKSGASRGGRSQSDSPLPHFIPPQLSQPVEKPPSGPQWLHEIKLDGYRMAAHIDDGRVQLLTRTGLDWTDKYPSAIAALANLNIKTAYIDGELWGVDEAGLPTFAHTQAATDGQRNVGSATRCCPSHLTPYPQDGDNDLARRLSPRVRRGNLPEDREPRFRYDVTPCSATAR
jgi:ATP-dependent DNA ligase